MWYYQSSHLVPVGTRPVRRFARKGRFSGQMIFNPLGQFEDFASRSTTHEEIIIMFC